MAGSRGAGGPIHPGEILDLEFRVPHGLSRARLARATGLSSGRLVRLARGRGRPSGEAALLLARVFRTTPEFWLNLQAHYDLGQAQAQLTPPQVARARALGDQLQRARRRKCQPDAPGGAWPPLALIGGRARSGPAVACRRSRPRALFHSASATSFVVMANEMAPPKSPLQHSYL